MRADLLVCTLVLVGSAAGCLDRGPSPFVKRKAEAVGATAITTTTLATTSAPSAAPVEGVPPAAAPKPPSTKPALPRCGAGQSLFAEGEDAAPFCARTCSSDADCKPVACSERGFPVDDSTGVVRTGVGKDVPLCAKGAATALVAPPGGPAVIANPKSLECPQGYTKLLGPNTCNKSCLKEKCPTGTTCQSPLSFCM
jgi:hypothetical protein